MFKCRKKNILLHSYSQIIKATNLLPKTFYVGASFANDGASILGSKNSNKHKNTLPTELRVRTRNDSSPMRGRGILFGGGLPKDASPQSPRSRFLPVIISDKQSTTYKCQLPNGPPPPPPPRGMPPRGAPSILLKYLVTFCAQSRAIRGWDNFLVDVFVWRYF